MNLFNKAKANIDTMATILKHSMCMNCTIHAWSEELKEIWNTDNMIKYCPFCWNYTNDFYKQYLLAETDEEKKMLQIKFKQLQQKQREQYENNTKQ